MKNILLLLIGFTITIDAIAQPTLTAATTNPVVGDIFYGQDQADLTGISNGSGGAGITWNFAFLDTITTDTTQYLTCSSTPYCDSFPGSTLATFDGYDYYYYITNDTEFAENGIGEPASSGGGLIYFYNPLSLIDYPTTYGSVKIDSYDFAQPEFGDSSWGADSFIADAYGTLILPSGTYENVLRIHVIFHETDVFTLIDSALDTTVVADSFRADSYLWFDTGFHNPLLVMGYDTTGDSDILMDAEYYTGPPQAVTDTVSKVNNVAMGALLHVYPNPTDDKLNIQLTGTGGGKVTISAMDIMGQMVKQPEDEDFAGGLNTVSYDVSGLAPGVYFIRVQSSENAWIEKVLIER